MHYLNQPKEILPDTITFLSIVTLSIIPFMIFQTMREVSEGLSFTIGVTKATIFANVINVILNYVFIEHFKMGVAGSAWATLVYNTRSAQADISDLKGLVGMATTRVQAIEQFVAAQGVLNQEQRDLNNKVYQELRDLNIYLRDKAAKDKSNVLLS